MDRLRTVYTILSEQLGQQLEPFEVWQIAEQHRMFWKPERVKTLLLAESHVFTSELEAQTQVDLSPYTDVVIPPGFVRLVYCLGYGESGLLDTTVTNNTGTPQFWKIFWSCIHRVTSNKDFASILKGGSKDTEVRIRNKLDLLYQLKSEGVWLLDASLAALYSAGTKPDASAMLTCLKSSWPYVSARIAEASPEQIIVIGKGVAKALDPELKTFGVPVYVMPQPQARLSSADHLSIFQRYYDLVHDRHSIGDIKPPLDKVSATTDSAQPRRRWTLNLAKGAHHHGVVGLVESPLVLELWVRADSDSPKRYVGTYTLDLPDLLSAGFIRYEPAGAIGDKVRVRVVHIEGDQFGLQVNQSGPVNILGGVTDGT